MDQSAGLVKVVVAKRTQELIEIKGLAFFGFKNLLEVAISRVVKGFRQRLKPGGAERGVEPGK
jgi:hypothetical protein